MGHMRAKKRRERRTVQVGPWDVRLDGREGEEWGKWDGEDGEDGEGFWLEDKTDKMELLFHLRAGMINYDGRQLLGIRINIIIRSDLQTRYML